MNRIPLLALSLAALGGCRWTEPMIIENMTGTVVLPEEAGTRAFLDDAGQAVDKTDVRLIGPVYLGLYASVQDGLEAYPYPEVGPQFEDGVPGDTYPYGGTTVGDLRYACVEFLRCKFVSGRYKDFDALVDWFSETLQDPILDQFGNEIPNGEFLRQTCFDLLEYTNDAELRMTAYEDRNGDGVIDEGDLDFVQREDGKFEAEFTIWQQEWFDNRDVVEDAGGAEEEIHGFTLWGFMDTPADLTYEFSTCDPENGYLETTYNNYFFGGRPYQDILNQPGFYIGQGDWVASEGFVYENWYDRPELNLDFQVTE